LKHKRFRFFFISIQGGFLAFPESLPERFPEETGSWSGIMEVASKRALPPNNFKTPLEGSGYN
jgi:hypothetical protein